jgi:hypothetical protein
MFLHNLLNVLVRIANNTVFKKINLYNITNISPLIQLLEQIAIQQYEVKALTHSQVKVQPKTSESYRTIIKALAKKCTEYHTYKLKEFTE